jgi:hypothetical protein
MPAIVAHNFNKFFASVWRNRRCFVVWWRCLTEPLASSTQSPRLTMKSPACFLAAALLAPALFAQTPPPRDAFKTDAATPKAAEPTPDPGSPKAAPSVRPETGAAADVSPDALFVLEIFHVPKQIGSRLLAKKLDGTQLRGAIQQSLGKDGTALDKLVMIRTRSGQRAKVEQLDEVPLAHSYHKPAAPETLLLSAASLDMNKLLPLAKSLRPDADKTAPQAPPNSNKPPGAVITPLLPSEFEIQNLGESIEIDPIFSEDGLQVDVKLAPESQRLLGFTDFGATKKAVLEIRKLTSAVTLQWTRPFFVGTLSRPSDTGTAVGGKNDMLGMAFLTGYRGIMPAVKREAPPDPNRRLQLRSVVELVSMEKATVAQLMTNYAADDVALRVQLDKLLDDGRAKMENVLSLPTHSGERAKVENIEPFYYWTDFGAPVMPKNLFLLGSDAAAQAAPVRGGALPGTGWISPPVPNRCEARNLGASLEIDPVAEEDGITIHVSIAPEICRLAGYAPYSEVKMPVFETQKLSTAVTLRADTPRLLGTMSPPVNTGIEGGNKEDRIWLAFLTVFVE